MTACSALMARMDIPKVDRPYVKLECLRILTTLKMDPAKSDLIGAFQESYLKLTARENQIFGKAFENLSPEVKEEAMEIMSSWKREGYEKGLQEGRREGRHMALEQVLVMQLDRRFSTLPADLTQKLDALTVEQLNKLVTDSLDFTKLDDLDEWISNLDR